MNALKKYLTLNSLFSLLSGLIMVLLSEKLRLFFGIEHPYIFQIIGANLIVFSIFVWYVSRQQNSRLLVNIVSMLDLLWVVGSLLIIAFNLFNISENGKIIIAIVAVWIGFLGLKQYQNNKMITKNS